MMKKSESPRLLMRNRGMLEGRGLLTILLFAAFLWSLGAVPWSRGLLHPGSASALRQFGEALLSPELSADFLAVALRASWQTVTFAVGGLTLALLIGLPLGVVASGVLAQSSSARFGSIGAVRFILAFFRSIHELVWAWFFVAAIGLSPMAAILALGINYGGILGRIYAEIFSDVPEGPLKALRASGASELKVFLYGRLPMAMPDIVGYTFYRLECGIRSAAIMSFVGIAGLGFQIALSLDDLHFDQVWTLLFFLVALIVVIDVWSNAVRRRLVA